MRARTFSASTRRAGSEPPHEQKKNLAEAVLSGAANASLSLAELLELLKC